MILIGLVLACWARASALDPSLDISQYAHTAWTVRQGFFKGAIEAIAQTSDGYLWLGTEFGLLRFDGVRSVLWQPPAGERLPSDSILSLLAARDGRLWIGTAKGLVSWKDGKLTLYPELTGQNVFALPLLEDRDGTIWAGGYGIPTGRLCAIQGGQPRCYGKDGVLGSIVGYLYEDSGDNLWVGAATGLWRWKPGSPKLYPMPGPPPGISGLLEADKGALLIAMPAESDGLLTGNPRHTRSRPGSSPLVCSAIAMAVCGSERLTGGSCMCTKAGRIDFRSLTVSQAMLFMAFLRIAKVTFGSPPVMGSTAFASSPSPQFL